MAENGKIGSGFGNAVVVAFLVTQALDGVLTYVGVSMFGPTVEGNPLIINLMHLIGETKALAYAKIVAATLGIVLHLSGVHRVVAFLTGVYFAAAIVPWTALLFF